MEVNHQEIGENRLPIPVTKTEAATLEIIRTETVLSRLPVHNLAKTGHVNIQIIKTTPSGEVELKWEVSYSERYGQARQLAYKLDTIVINQRIDEAGRPLPKILRIGSLNEICAELNLATHAGQNAKDLKRAFLQNASAFITAKFNYRANDNSERHVEAGITRYGVIFTGEKLPDGRKADAVYIMFNDPFWEVLNNAPVRPLDRAYMKELPPGAQRFYEIVSRKMFAALKNNYPHAKISYSEYCTFSAQLRHFERQRVQDQMAKVLRSHKTSGYIAAVRYEPAIDGENKPDWILYLTPGPRARAEFDLVHRRKPRKAIAPDGIQIGDRPWGRERSAPQNRQAVSEPITTQPTFDPQLVAEFTRRGITEKKALELLANRKPGQDVVAQLEIGDQLIERAGFKILNPAGFLIKQIERNAPIPDGFETSAKRRAREEREQKERAQRAAEEARQELEDEYERYCYREVDRYIEANQTAFDAIKEARAKEERERHHTPSWSDTSMAVWAARHEIRKQVSLPTFEEFVAMKQQVTDLLSKPFAVPPIAATASAAFPSDGLVPVEEPEGNAMLENPAATANAEKQSEPPASPETVTPSAEDHPGAGLTGHGTDEVITDNKGGHHENLAPREPAIEAGSPAPARPEYPEIDPESEPFPLTAEFVSDPEFPPPDDSVGGQALFL